MANSFLRKLEDLSSKRDSRLILALDLVGPDGLYRSRELVRELRDYVIAVKLGYPTILSNYARGIREFTGEFSDRVSFIADAKIADVSHVNRRIADNLFSMGFDAVIAHGFIGYEGGLDGLAEIVREKGKGLIVLVSMSNKGAINTMDEVVDEILKESLKTNPSGFVAPATRPNMIRILRTKISPDMKIFAPGVGAQGAPYGSALSSGADYEIVGRAIYDDKDPVGSAESVVESQRVAVRR